MVMALAARTRSSAGTVLASRWRVGDDHQPPAARQPVLVVVGALPRGRKAGGGTEGASDWTVEHVGADVGWGG